jgi:nucleotide-binding universal stress UspA family protein
MAVTASPSTSQVSTSISLKNILVATDFSECSQSILPFAESLARRYGSSILLAHVIPTEIVTTLEGSATEPIESTVLREMEDLESSEYLKGLNYTHIIRTAPEVWPVLREIIEREGVDLVMVGTHGRTGLSKIVMGSVAEAIFRTAPCPVLTIGPKTSARHDGDLKRVLYVTDLKSRNPYAEILAAGLAAKQNGCLLLMHVAEICSDAEVAARKLKEMASEANLGQPTKLVIEVGEPATKILGAATDQEVDLIVLGVDRPAVIPSHLEQLAYRAVYDGPVSALMTGDWDSDPHLAYRVVCAAPCPVLTVGVQTEKRHSASSRRAERK